MVAGRAACSPCGLRNLPADNTFARFLWPGSLVLLSQVDVATGVRIAHLDFPDRFARHHKSRKRTSFTTNFKQRRQSGDLHHAASTSRPTPNHRPGFHWGNAIPTCSFFAERKAATATWRRAGELNMTAALAGRPNPRCGQVHHGTISCSRPELARELAAQPPAHSSSWMGCIGDPTDGLTCQKWCPEAGKFLKERYNRDDSLRQSAPILPK